jgi:hypothetical protein
MVFVGRLRGFSKHWDSSLIFRCNGRSRDGSRHPWSARLGIGFSDDRRMEMPFRSQGAELNHSIAKRIWCFECETSANAVRS